MVEADESDGSVVNYHPAVGVILNLQRDHKEEDEVAAMFAAFRAQAREGFVVGEAANLAPFAPGAAVFGFGAGAGVRARDVREGAFGSSFRVDQVGFRLAVPGRHNVANALAAIAACRAFGVPLAAMAGPLAGFQGVARRFQSLGSARGVEVVDDFGHNPAKIAASLRTAHRRGRRLLAVFQPHGYGPLRFMRDELVAAFAAELEPQDRLWLLDVFYAGGHRQQGHQLRAGGGGDRRPGPPCRPCPVPGVAHRGPGRRGQGRRPGAGDGRPGPLPDRVRPGDPGGAGSLIHRSAAETFVPPIPGRINEYFPRAPRSCADASMTCSMPSRGSIGWSPSGRWSAPPVRPWSGRSSSSTSAGPWA